ncbi:hypothetical protein [Arthrobacter oryzae]|uniref:hypothetical protein n=1 Tax=Arthrobacter oryzae TaxID=409290 RepID=UPI00352C845E
MGSYFAHYVLENSEDPVMVLDKLTWKRKLVADANAETEAKYKNRASEQHYVMTQSTSLAACTGHYRSAIRNPGFSIASAT